MGFALRRLASARELDVRFVDVGANIGAMVVDTAAHPKTSAVYAFEPHPLCAEACGRSAELNRLTNVHLRRMALNDGAETRMRFDPFPPSSALDPAGEPVPGGTLDGELGHLEPPAILLLDVEGSELAVLRGGNALLKRCRPLVIFEYDALGRGGTFPISDVQDILGAEYRIFRLRVDGRLDGRTEEAWNCVAVAAGSPFEVTCRRLRVD